MATVSSPPKPMSPHGYTPSSTSIKLMSTNRQSSLNELRQSGSIKPQFSPGGMSISAGSPGKNGGMQMRSPGSPQLPRSPNSPVGSLLAPLSSTSRMTSPFMTEGDKSVSTVAKVAQLSSQLSDMDHDLENQQVTRKQREVRLSTMAEQISTIHSHIQQINHRGDKIESRLSRLENELAMEKDARTELGRSLKNLVDQRTSELSARLDGEHKGRVAGQEELKGGLQKVVSQCAALQTGLATTGENVQQLEQFTGRLAERTAGLRSALGQETQARQTEADNNLKKLTANISAVQGALEYHKGQQHKALEGLDHKLNGEVNQLKRMAQQDKSDMRTMTDKLLKPLSESITELQHSLNTETKQRDQAIATSEEQLQYALQDLKRSMEINMNNANHDFNTKHKQSQDRMWKIEQGMEREQEERNTAVQDLQASLDKENTARQQSEEAMTELVRQAMHKIKSGIEPRSSGATL